MAQRVCKTRRVARQASVVRNDLRTARHGRTIRKGARRARQKLCEIHRGEMIAVKRAQRAEAFILLTRIPRARSAGNTS